MKTLEATKRTSIPLRFMSVTAFAKCPQARKNSHTQASLQWLFITHLYALISLLSRTLLDNCSNTTRMNFAFHALPGIIAQTGFFIGFSFMHCCVSICTINPKFVANLLQNCFFVAKSVNPLSGLFPRKSLNSLIDSPLTLFSLLLLLLRKYPLLY